MQYKITRTNRKTLAIHIKDGEVIVRSPLKLDEKIIHRFVLEKETWIKSKLEDYVQTGLNLNKQELNYFGEIREIKLIDAKEFKVDIKDKIYIYRPKHLKDETIIKRTEDYFKDILDKYINRRLDYYAKVLRIEKPPYIIRRYKRMHGRCSRKGDLAFNLYLYHYDYKFIDYVILHECAHLFEFNHSKAFYAIIEKHMPKYKEIIKEYRTLSHHN